MKHERNEKAVITAPPSLRWRKLLKDKEGLLRKIQRKASEIEEISRHVSFCQRLISEGLEDSEQRLEEIRGEIEELLDKILARKKLNRRQKREIIELRYIFSKPAEEMLSSPQEPEESPNPSPSRNIRKRYLKIAHLVHPDRAQTDEQRIRFTSLMQELNHAYLKGDLAALLKVESSLEDPLRGDENFLEDECEELEQENNLLREQCDELSHELSLLRKQPLVQFVLNGLSRGEDYRQIADAALEEIADEVRSLQSIRHFIQQYVDGRISIDRFLLGPEGYDKDDLIDDQIFLELIDEAETIVEDVMREERATRRRLRARAKTVEEKRKRRRRRR